MTIKRTEEGDKKASLRVEKLILFPNKTFFFVILI